MPRAGDAAHSFPPTGGLGLNSGIADVHNIAYKIAAVQQGWATYKLLESYGGERRAVSDIASTQSVKNGKKIFSFLKALGTAGINDPEEARRVLHKTIHDPSRQKLIADEVENQREHFDNMELHIGYVYGSKELPPNASNYLPKFVPGARLPHGWIRFPSDKLTPPTNPSDLSFIGEMSKDEVQARKYSTLDLCAFDGFTIIVGCRQSWLKRFRALTAAMKPTGLKLALHAADCDFDFVLPDGRLLFDIGVGLDTGSGLLLRPDQHILTILSPDISAEALKAELCEHLGL
ncbi:hypothetical protein LTR29_017410 [Friedmanniomyces endolithicus]|nr:hypothetical protein LTR29_017410 [Friedmanniomyces endolithicus]